MIIMIIFLVLTFIFIVGTVIYLNYKKKSNKVNIQDYSNTQKKKKNRDKKKLSNILQVNIKDNIICLGNRYSMVIRLGNIDYNMLSNREQESVENTLIQTALAIDFPIQFFSTTEYIDTSKVVALIRQNKPNNDNIREYKEYLIRYLENLMDNRTISVVKNYAVISYDGFYENAIDELNRKTMSFKNNLLRAQITCETLDENELYNLLYRELNKNESVNISSLKEGGKNLYVGKKQKARKK